MDFGSIPTGFGKRRGRRNPRSSTNFFNRARKRRRSPPFPKCALRINSTLRSNPRHTAPRQHEVHHAYRANSLGNLHPPDSGVGRARTGHALHAAARRQAAYRHRGGHLAGRHAGRLCAERCRAICRRKRTAPSWTELHVVDTKGNSTPFITGPVNVGSIAWTPDGKSIAFLTKREKDRSALALRHRRQAAARHASLAHRDRHPGLQLLRRRQTGRVPGDGADAARPRRS